MKIVVSIRIIDGTRTEPVTDAVADAPKDRKPVIMRDARSVAQSAAKILAGVFHEPKPHLHD